MKNVKTAIITGGGQGMGRACALAFAKKGIRTVINDLDESKAENTVEEINKNGGQSLIAVGDVSSKHEVEEVITKTMSHYNSVDILINNAGVLKPTKTINITEKEWDWIISVNLKGTFLFSQAVLSFMRKTGWGRIINFSSTAGKNISTVGGAHYTAAKAGILGFTRHLANEEAKYGITVNSVCPGLIDTEMVKKTINDKELKKYATSFPIQRLGTVEEVASLVLFLSSDQAAYITGASIDINGGDLMI
jgi:NAD(P)-dependent dehydrogenase (short-subunit alcohol dehydrogenase family)